MATIKITALPTLDSANVAAGDLIPIVDASLDVTSKMTYSSFFNNIPTDINLSAATTETRYIAVGNGRTGDGTSYIDLIGDATYSDYGARFTRIAGANGTTALAHRGTGPFLLNAVDAAPIVFNNTAAESARFTPSGQLVFGSTAEYTDGTIGTPSLQINSISGSYVGTVAIANVATAVSQIAFRNPNGLVGSISTSGSATLFNTSSDYRLKEDVQPLFGASDRVLALNPVNFAWKVDGNRIDGFLAHEAQAVVPDAVMGQKDEVNADGEAVYQSIDHSKMVPLLTAALQEALTKIADLEARLEIAGL
jgi:hypothetical protein